MMFPAAKFPLAFLVAAVFSLCGSGCYTDGSGRIVFGRRPAGPTPEQLREARIQRLEASLSQLQSEVDGVGTSVNTVAMQSDQLSRATDARGADAVALRRDLNQISARLDELEKRLDQIPGTLQASLAQEHKSIVTEVNRALAESDKRINTQLNELSKKVRSSSRSASTAAAAPTGSGRYYEHVVASGETLSEIARAYGVSLQSILQENRISDPAKIRVNQKLFIPAP